MTLSSKQVQKGAALLLAMMVLASVVVLSVAAVSRHWQQKRVASLQSTKVQHNAVLAATLQWAYALLMQDAREGYVDHLQEQWSRPMRVDISVFLFGDSNSSAYIHGHIEDLSAKWNIWPLIMGMDNLQYKGSIKEIARRISKGVGLNEDTIVRAVEAYRQRRDKTLRFFPDSPHGCLLWLGLTAQEIQKLQPYVTCIAQEYALNINTVSPLLLTWLEGEEISKWALQERQIKPFDSYSDIENRSGQRFNIDFFMPGSAKVGWDVRSKWFDVHARASFQEVTWNITQTVRRGQYKIVPIGVAWVGR